MPSAMSRPREPVDTVSTSIALLFLPRRMMEPLPKLRSIWESAASSAFDLSMEKPSTMRSAVAIAFAPYDEESEGGQICLEQPAQCTLFVLYSQDVPFGGYISPLNSRCARYPTLLGDNQRFNLIPTRHRP